MYRIEDWEIEQLIIVNKGKQWEKQVQNEEVFLCKPYNISSNKSKEPKPTFIQDKINNLERYMKYIQSPVKTILLYPLPHYKSIQPQGEQNKQYWNKITVEFLKQKHNADALRKRFLIKIYMEEPSHKPYFIMLILWEQVIVGPTKKLVVSHMVGDLALLD